MTEDEKNAIRAEARHEALMITLGAIIAASPNRDAVEAKIGETLHARQVRGEPEEFKQGRIAEYLDMLFPENSRR